MDKLSAMILNNLKTIILKNIMGQHTTHALYEDNLDQINKCAKNLLSNLWVNNFYNINFINVLKHVQNLIKTYNFTTKKVRCNNNIVEKICMHYSAIMIIYNIKHIDENLLNNVYIKAQIKILSDMNMMSLIFNNLHANKITKIPYNILCDNNYLLTIDQISILAECLTNDQKINLFKLTPSTNCSRIMARCKYISNIININICIKDCTVEQLHFLVDICVNFSKICAKNINTLNSNKRVYEYNFIDLISKLVIFVDKIESTSLDICQIIEKYYFLIGKQLIELRKLSWNHEKFFDTMLKWCDKNEIKIILNLTQYYYNQQNLFKIIDKSYYSLVELFINNKVEFPKDFPIKHNISYLPKNSIALQQMINYYESSGKKINSLDAINLMRSNYRVNVNDKDINIIIYKCNNNIMPKTIKNESDFNEILLGLNTEHIVEKIMRKFKIYNINSKTKGHILALSQKKYFIKQCDKVDTTIDTLKEFIKCMSDEYNAKNINSFRILCKLIKDI